MTEVKSNSDLVITEQQVCRKSKEFGLMTFDVTIASLDVITRSRLNQEVFSWREATIIE
jgi:hypothetical protein